MTPWAMLYERLIGHPPAASQVARMERIRSILRLRDEDAFWHVVIIQDFYATSIGTAVKRFDAIRGELVALRSQAVPTWGDLVALARRPPAIALLTLLVALPAVVSGGTAGIVTAWVHRGDEQARLRERDEWRADLAQGFAAMAASIERDRASDRGAAASSEVPRDPATAALAGVVERLSPDDKARLAADPDATAQGLHALAGLSAEGQKAFEVRNDPAADEAMRRQQTLQWFVGQVALGEKGATRLVAAYAARNTKLAGALRGLPAACSPAALGACQ